MRPRASAGASMALGMASTNNFFNSQRRVDLAIFFFFFFLFNNHENASSTCKAATVFHSYFFLFRIGTVNFAPGNNLNLTYILRYGSRLT